MADLSSFEQEELIRRISRDLVDGYDEELEMELEDHHPLPDSHVEADNGAAREYRREYQRDRRRKEKQTASSRKSLRSPLRRGRRKRARDN